MQSEKIRDFAKARASMDNEEGGKSEEQPKVSIDDLRITEEEMQAARITPTCIVDDYLYADVGTLAAPGGTGKTTLVLYEMINIALARPLYGLEVYKSGICLLITSEDRKEQCAARLREMMSAMKLTDVERKSVLDKVLIWDVTGTNMRLVINANGNIIPTSLADTIIALFQDQKPAVITFDPSVSFGASEGMVNDNEQAIINACRRIVRSLDCCVRMVAHTGKMNARQGTLDQYSSRGGSALSDGARMVAVLQPWSPEDRKEMRPPYGCALEEGSSLTILARPKLSYAPANQPHIWVKRTGWNYETFTDIRQTPEERQSALFDQICLFLAEEVRNGVRHNKTSLVDALISNLIEKRDPARAAIGILIAKRRITEKDLPADEQKTKRKTYLVTA